MPDGTNIIARQPLYQSRGWGHDSGSAALGSFFGAAFKLGASAASGGATNAIGGLFGPGGLSGGNAEDARMAKFEELLDRQISVQSEMQVYSSSSNIAKTTHETAMTAIRNMKA
ncbi:MAG: hypothetical protein KDB53_01030 [Planctomycetes bacterium]|nr:hypothetical protein [Planctomycetota bacterium]